jgi:hypothetical protein
LWVTWKSQIWWYDVWRYQFIQTGLRCCGSKFIGSLQCRLRIRAFREMSGSFRCYSIFYWHENIVYHTVWRLTVSFNANLCCGSKFIGSGSFIAGSGSATSGRWAAPLGVIYWWHDSIIYTMMIWRLTVSINSNRFALLRIQIHWIRILQCGLRICPFRELSGSSSFYILVSSMMIWRLTVSFMQFGVVDPNSLDLDTSLRTQDPPLQGGEQLLHTCEWHENLRFDDVWQ